MATAPTTDYTGIAQQLYQTYLGREGDDEGVAYWADRLANQQPGQGGTVVGDFKESARTTLDNYLKTGESDYADYLGEDLSGAGSPGTFSGTRYDNAKTGLEGNVFARLYGSGPQSTTTPKPGMTSSGAPSISVPEGAFADPVTWDVTSDQTVASQLEKLLKTDNPLMQLAATRAQQSAEARGLSNSSMAATAGHAAAIESAMPIAQADAGTYAGAAQFNAGAKNTFAQQGNQRVWDAAMANFNLKANDWLAGQNFARDWQLQDRSFAQTKELRGIDFANDKTLRGINFGYEKELREIGSDSTQNTLSRGYINAINQARSDYARDLATISSNKDMSAELKTQTLENLRVSYNTVIQNYAKLLGWDPASWLIATSPASGSSSGGSGGGVTDPGSFQSGD